MKNEDNVEKIRAKARAGIEEVEAALQLYGLRVSSDEEEEEDWAVLASRNGSEAYVFPSEITRDGVVFVENEWQRRRDGAPNRQCYFRCSDGVPFLGKVEKQIAKTPEGFAKLLATYYSAREAWERESLQNRLLEKARMEQWENILPEGANGRVKVYSRRGDTATVWIHEVSREELQKILDIVRTF